MTGIASPRIRPNAGQLTSTEIDCVAALNSIEPTPKGYILIKTENGFENVLLKDYVNDINGSSN
jgi:hypothetical protein